MWGWASSEARPASVWRGGMTTLSAPLSQRSVRNMVLIHASLGACFLSIVIFCIHSHELAARHQEAPRLAWWRFLVDSSTAFIARSRVKEARWA